MEEIKDLIMSDSALMIENLRHENERLREKIKEQHFAIAALLHEAGGEVRVSASTLVKLPRDQTIEIVKNPFDLGLVLRLEKVV